MFDKRLIGTWRSDKRRTAAEIRARRDIPVAVVLAAIGTLFGTVRTTAQAGPGAEASLPRCFATATTQLQMNRCARDEAARADAELDRILRALLMEAAKDAVTAEKIKAAQATWLAYRDAMIEAAYPARDKKEYGSIYPMELSLLRAKLTMRHADSLRQMLDH